MTSKREKKSAMGFFSLFRAILGDESSAESAD
jgi:hypothetical protein